MNPIIVSAAGIGITALVGVLAFFMKYVLNKTEKGIEETRLQIKLLEQSFNDHKEKMPVNYVLRDDFIRVTTSIENKLDKAIGLIMEMGGKNNGA